MGEIAERLAASPRAIRHSGWAGVLIEAALGTDASSLPQPDFRALGLELKTLATRGDGRPVGNTFVCSVELNPTETTRWEDSRLWRKLQRVLWVPILTEPGLPPIERRVGSPFIWSPTEEEGLLLRADWEELLDRLRLFGATGTDSLQGRFLQVRAKAGEGGPRVFAIDDSGERIRHTPLGFYLRSAFTRRLLASSLDKTAAHSENDSAKTGQP